MHGQDTLPLNGKHHSAMNEQNRNCVKTTPLLFPQVKRWRKMTWGKNSKRPWVQSIFMESLHWGKWRGLMIQQISVYINTCSYCIIVTSHDQ